jgi:hypothetical protein
MWLLCQRSAGQPDGSAGEREEVDRCATPVWWKDGRCLPMGTVLPTALAVAIQTLPKIKIEKDGARECIICCDNMEVGVLRVYAVFVAPG